MNRYFYVPVTSKLVVRGGTTLADHLKVVDSELFHRGGVDDYIAKDALQFQYLIDTESLYHEKLLPSRIIIVSSDDEQFYELSSGEVVQIDSLSDVLSYEVSGIDVVDIFADNPDYKSEVLNFFRLYASKTSDGEDTMQKMSNTKVKGKRKIRLPRIFSRK